MVFVTINDVFRKHLQIVVSAGVWVLFSESITAGRCESRKLYGTKHPVQWTGHFENHEFFQNIDAGGGFKPLNS